MCSDDYKLHTSPHTHVQIDEHDDLESIMSSYVYGPIDYDSRTFARAHPTVRPSFLPPPLIFLLRLLLLLLYVVRGLHSAKTAAASSSGLGRGWSFEVKGPTFSMAT